MQTTGMQSQEVTIRLQSAVIAGTLTTPSLDIEQGRGLVVFAHGSGSSRHSPRNQSVARTLNQRGLCTLLMDLLTEEESADRRNVFDLALLGQRVVEVTRWAFENISQSPAQHSKQSLSIGYFGASTGAGAALVAAAELGQRVHAVVSRGGRPDLAGAALERVTAPTLLLVGSRDEPVIELNREAQARMRCETKLSIIPGATHLFEEPGTLEQVAKEAGDWLVTHLNSQNQRSL